MAVFDGTAAELAELTRKHWEADWWPKGGPTGSDPLSLRGPIGYEWNGQIVNFRTYHEAADTIFAAAMVWLAENARTVELVQTKNQRTPWRVYLRGATHAVDGPSPLHAVLAAVEVVS